MQDNRRAGFGRISAILVVLATISPAASAVDDTLPEPEQVFVVTVADKDASHPNFGIGSKMGMVVDGAQGKELILTRGKTYAFKVETDVQHDFYLTTSPVGRGAEVLTEGVTGNFTYRGVVTFKPTSATPQLAYYQCRNHNSMGGKLHIVDPGQEHKINVNSPAEQETLQSTGTADDIVVTESQVKQKIGFGDMFINQSQAAKRLAQSTNDDALSMYKQSQEKLVEARQIAEQGDFNQAMLVIDEALQLMSEASRLVPSASQIEEQHSRFTELMEGIKTFEASYKKNLERMSGDAKKNAGRLDLKQIDDMVQQATKLADDNQYAEANKLLSKAQRAITAELSVMLDNSTVVYDKDFATPAEEYEYELARYKSYEELIPIALEQKQPSKRGIELMDQFVEKARELKVLASKEAEKQNYETTIQMLQAATDHLQRALQIAGVR